MRRKPVITGLFMFRDEKKNCKTERTKVRNTVPHAALNLLILVVGVFMSLSIVQSLDAAPVDRTGLDFLCKDTGGTYHMDPKGKWSTCACSDGQTIICDIKKDKCYNDINPRSGAMVVEGAVTLRSLKLLNDKVDNLTKQVQSLTSSLNEAEIKKRPTPSP